ncbi:MAG: nucleotidyltransferase family protein [Spirochaetaceae bacterium]|nr:nucleotidyltransferase family protein [Spirochaetaceae bacterium]
MLNKVWARAARRAVSMEEFYTLVKTKRYTHARIRRLALRAYLSLPDVPFMPPYLRVLAANESGLSLLRDIKKNAALPLLTRPASVKKMGGAARACFDSEARVTDLYALCWSDSEQRRGGREWRTGPAVERRNAADQGTHSTEGRRT